MPAGVLLEVVSSPVFWQKAARIHPLACIPLEPKGDISIAWFADKMSSFAPLGCQRQRRWLPVPRLPLAWSFLETKEDYSGSSQENRKN